MTVSDLRLTEVMYNPAVGGYEYIEITNTGTTAVSADDFYVGNSDFLPEYYDTFGPGLENYPMIPAGATIVLVPSFPDFSGEVFVPPLPITQAEFEAVYGPLPAGAIFLNYASFTVGGNDGLPGGLSYTIAGGDIYGDSVYIPDGAAPGQSVTVSLEDGSTSIGTPTPGFAGAVTPPETPTNGDDIIMGTDGEDTINLLDGRDSYMGGLGDDTVFGGDGNDTVDGGRDNDTLDLGQGNDNAWGGEGDDQLFGGTGLDRLNGNSGDDNIFGGKGGDILQGGKGEDYIDGGRQSDSISGGEQSDEIYGGAGSDTIDGDEGADLIYGGSGNDEINGGTFDDTIYGDHGKDTLNGGADNDTLYGGASNDKVNGNSGDDFLFGGKGSDKLTGGSGNDLLDGGSQSDRMDGGSGEDILYGGLGHDELTGGADADTFVFAGTVNNDVITDFEVGVDQIDLTAYGPVSEAEAISIASQVGSDVVLDLGPNGEVTLQGTDLADLSLDDFIFVPDILIVA